MWSRPTRKRALAALQSKFENRNSFDLSEGMRAANSVFDAVLADRPVPSIPESSRWDVFIRGMNAARSRSSRALGVGIARMYSAGLERLHDDWKKGVAVLKELRGE
jgi:hypothetical protein